MRPVPMLWVIVVAVLLLAAGLVIGYAIPRPAHGAASSPGSGTLSIIAAGTLGAAFAGVASLVANESPGVSAPLASQQYEGSLAVLAAVAQLHAAYDVVAAADDRLIPQQLEPAWAGWEVDFASTPEVLVYDPSVAALAGINTTNWPATILSSGLPLGIANASTDPNGYNEIFVLELEGLLEDHSLAALYSHFFTTPVGSLAVPNPATTRVEPETNVASLLASHTIALFITYRSYAVSHQLAFVDFAPSVGLGSFDPANTSLYAQASTTIAPASGPEVVHGAPVVFAATVPSNAPNATLGQLFVHALISPAGAAILQADGLAPLAPAWSDRPADLPPLLAPDVVPVPGGLGG
jgi:molybdate/tungstate transport system substrate-binding protein